MQNPNQFQTTLEEVARQQRELQEKLRAESILNYFTKIHGAQWDKSVAYTNLIIIAGYASYFALWTQVRDHLQPLAELTSALSMLISATVFVSWEVFKMIHSAFYLRKQSKIIFKDGNNKNADEIVKRYEQYEVEANRASIPFTRLWIVNLCVAIPFAILAIAILGYGIVSGLIASYFEYSR